MQARTLKIIAALLIISALFMGIIGYKISQQEIKRVEPTTATSTSSDYVYAQKLLVTTRTLAQGETLTAEDLTLTPFPIKVDDSFNRIGDAVGKTVEFDIAKGEVLRTTHFEKKSTLTQLIEPGHRALAVKVDEVVGTGGFLKPGDHVDVIFSARASKETYDKSLSRRILRNVKVLAFGEEVESERPEVTTPEEKKNQRSGREDGKKSRSAVLQVSEKDVNKLILAEERGELRLVAVGEADLAQLENDQGSELASDDANIEDDATFIKAVTGLTPPPRPKSVYVYNGDKVETVRVPK